MSLFVLVQIRFALRIRKIKKNNANLPGVLIMTEALDGIGGCFACIECCGQSATVLEKRDDEEEKKAVRERTEKMLKERDEREATKEIEVLSIEEEIEKVQEMVKGSPKTSLGWVVNTTKLPIKRVVVIIGNDPNLMIVNDQIINLSMLTEAELEEREMKERIRKRKVREQKPIKRITATEKERNKLIEIVSTNPKTGLIFASNVSKLTKEEIVLIIESEPDFEIRDEYIINKKKVRLKEEKKKAAENTCPNCENQFDPGSEFCPNCGLEL